MKPLKEEQKTRLICMLQLALIGGYLLAVFRKELGYGGRTKKKK